MIFMHWVDDGAVDKFLHKGISTYPPEQRTLHCYWQKGIYDVPISEERW